MKSLPSGVGPLRLDGGDDNVVILLLEPEELAKVSGELGSTPAMGESATST